MHESNSTQQFSNNNLVPKYWNTHRSCVGYRNATSAQVNEVLRFVPCIYLSGKEHYLLPLLSQFLLRQMIHILLHSKSTLLAGEGPEKGRGRDCCDVTNPMAAEPSVAPSPCYLGFLLHVGSFHDPRELSYYPGDGVTRCLLVFIRCQLKGEWTLLLN
jgi:hypothetical protein